MNGYLCKDTIATYFMQPVYFKDLQIIDYKSAWDYQESLLAKNIAYKIEARSKEQLNKQTINPNEIATQHYLLFCEHTPVYTLGKNGNAGNILIGQQDLAAQNIDFFHTNRGGDITFHGLQQLVGYPIFDLEKFDTDIGKYLRNIEEVIIKTIASYGFTGERSVGETGVWLDTGIRGKERKICAIGVRCSRWVTMHGFALNVNTDLKYFNNIIPCGIQNKQVTSLEKELGKTVDMAEVKNRARYYFEEVFNISIQPFEN